MEIWQKNALENIKRVIAEHDSQLAFAKKAKVSKTHLNMVLNGKKPLTRQFVASVAAYMNRDTEWFYTDHASAVESLAITDKPYAEAARLLEAFEAASPDKRQQVRGILFGSAAAPSDGALHERPLETNKGLRVRPPDDPRIAHLKSKILALVEEILRSQSDIRRRK